MKIVRKKTEFHKGGPGPLRPTRSYSLTVTTHRQLILSISKFRFNTFHFKESVDVTTFAEEEFSVNQTDVFGFPAEFLQKKVKNVDELEQSRKISSSALHFGTVMKIGLKRYHYG